MESPEGRRTRSGIAVKSAERVQPKRNKQKKETREDQTCPVCGEEVLHEMNEHINQCLDGTPTKKNSKHKKSTRNSRKRSASSEVTEKEEEDSFIDEDGIETYTVGDETRVRLVSLLENGYASIMDVRKRTRDDEGDLDVLEEAEYGNPQFGEQDLRVQLEDESEKILRERVLGDSIQASNVDHSNGRWAYESNSKEEEDLPSKRSKKNGKEEAQYAQLLVGEQVNQNQNLVVEALKDKIKELQGALQNVNKCTVCMGMYEKPLVSTICWHVHCEECWMAALGSKKLCPQCTSITTPNNLRRIFL